MPIKKENLRKHLKNQLPEIVAHINCALKGNKLESLRPVLKRIGRGGNLPHWFTQLQKQKSLPNLDGKTVGSVVEMLLVSVLEVFIFTNYHITNLRVNPARGIDLPDLDLGVKSPSENYCTSEPFFSAYERLYGSEHDALVLLTDYQSKKQTPPLRLQIINAHYLNKSQIADESLCRIAKKHRSWLTNKNENWAKKIFRFLAFVNQSDWHARWLLKIVDNMEDDKLISKNIKAAVLDFDAQNNKRNHKDIELIPNGSLEAIRKIETINPTIVGVIDAADSWIIETLKEMGRPPSDNEWKQLSSSPLDGKIGMSFALQWRYNFGRLFGTKKRL